MHERANSTSITGYVAPGYEPVKACFERQFGAGRHIGAGFSVWRQGVCVVDLWGGWADRASQRPWTRDTRLVVFSVTKGFVAMGFQLLLDRGMIDWAARVTEYWPEFGQAGKSDVTVGMLLNHQAGLAHVDRAVSLQDCIDPSQRDRVRRLLERQRPAWAPGTSQGYHALTFGLYARELFERVTGEDIGVFLERELFRPTGSDVRLGTPEAFDAKTATLYPPSHGERIGGMLRTSLCSPHSEDARILRNFLQPVSSCRAALMNPRTPRNDVRAYNTLDVRRQPLAWASATGSAQGIARVYQPFACGGTLGSVSLLRPETLAPLYVRQSWSERDRVLQKPIGWSGGFVKEDAGVFSPNLSSFGHPGMGGALGWADPTTGVSVGYVPNRMDWRVRSRRAMELMRSLYACDALRSTS